MDLFQIPWKKIDPIKNKVAVGGANFHYMVYSMCSETLKNILLHNASLDFIVILYKCSLVWPLLDSLEKFISDKKYGRGLLSLYGIKRNF